MFLFLSTVTFKLTSDMVENSCHFPTEAYAIFVNAYLYSFLLSEGNKKIVTKEPFGKITVSTPSPDV